MASLSPSLTLTIGIPTTDSSSFLWSSLERLGEQCAACPGSWAIDLVLCVNGARGAAAAITTAERFAQAHPTLFVEIFSEPSAGKNNAMNAILQRLRARPIPPDLVFFFDDDVRLSPGTLRRNAEALLAYEDAHRGVPTLVGAALRVEPLRWEQARQRHAHVFSRALRAWLQHQVFAFPYREDAPIPRFCEGMALGARLAHFPGLPGSDSGIGDDVFLSNTFALLGRSQVGEEGANLLKPPGSIGWVELSDDLETWRAQQIRTHLGIELCWRQFEPERPYLARCFAWPFAFTPDARSPFHPRGILEAVLYRVYMMFHEQNRRRAIEMIEAGHLPSWCSGEVTVHA